MIGSFQGGAVDASSPPVRRAENESHSSDSSLEGAVDASSVPEESAEGDLNAA